MSAVAGVAGFLVLLIAAEFLRPYRLALEAKAHAWERAQYEKCALKNEARASKEEDPLVREVHMGTARLYRQEAAKVRP